MAGLLRGDPAEGFRGPPSLRILRRVVQFLQQAARDPNVIAIKQTLYRTSSDSPIVKTLAEAAEAGKSVTALVELRRASMRRPNIRWARDSSGRRAVCSLRGAEDAPPSSRGGAARGQRAASYCHVGTGNYHPATGQDLHGPSPISTANPVVAATWRACSTSFTAMPSPPSSSACRLALTLRNRLTAISKEIEACQGRPPGRLLGQVQTRSVERPDHRHALPRQPGRRADRSRGGRHLPALRPASPGSRTISA